MLLACLINASNIAWAEKTDPSDLHPTHKKAILQDAMSHGLNFEIEPVKFTDQALVRTETTEKVDKVRHRIVLDISRSLHQSSLLHMLPLDMKNVPRAANGVSLEAPKKILDVKNAQAADQPSVVNTNHAKRFS
jgi:hypothetical protein